MKRILLIFLFGVLSFASFSQALFNRWSPASGTDTYSVNITSYTTLSNSVVYIKFPNTNTGASTLTINTTLGPAALRMWDGNSWEVLTAGQIDINTIYKLSYQGSYFEMESFGSGGGTWGSITGTLSSQTDLQAELDDKADKEFTINTQTNDYTLALTDRGKLIDMNDASGNDVTVPLNSVIAFPVGTTITITQKNTEQVTVVATGGVTINTSAGTLDGPGQNSPMVLVKTATDTWYLFNGTPGADHWRGSWDPTSGLPDDADAIGSGTAGAIQAGDMVIFSTSGTIDSELWPAATIAIAKQDSPTLASHWRLY